MDCMSGKKQPGTAMDLWTHDGALADAMRAAKLKMTPEAFAAASMDTCLQGDEVSVRVVDGIRTYSERGDAFATLAIAGKELVLCFAAPKNWDELSKVERFYQPLVDKRGWLEYRRPATRDPKPDLEADVGSILGRAAFERRQRR